MSKITRRIALLLALLSCVFSSKIYAQTPAQNQNAQAPQQQADINQQQPASLPQLLNLTPDQLARIKAINEQSRDEFRAAQQHLNQTRRALEEAIYSDTADESVVQQRARDVVEAQAALVRLRTRTEFSVRQVLTQEQLATLRAIRMAARQRARANRLNQTAAPGQRANRRQALPALNERNLKPEAAPPLRPRQNAPLRRPR